MIIKIDKQKPDTVVLEGKASISDYLDFQGYLEHHEVRVLDLKNLDTKILPNNWLELNSDLEVLILPKNLVRVPRLLCYNCYHLKHVEFGDKIEEIEECAFSFNRIKKLHIPSHIKKVARYAFSSSEVEKVYYNYSSTELDKTTFAFCDNIKVFEGYDEELER